jgi:hypothetical protein
MYVMHACMHAIKALLPHTHTHTHTHTTNTGHDATLSTHVHTTMHRDATLYV